MSASRWTAIAESQFPWEREALDWLRAELPDRDPWHAWTNFEFIDDEGKVNEIDALILSPAGLYLVEIKSRPGVVTGDPHTWTWTTDGREYSYDNPLLLANRKAKRLASVLRKQSSVVKSKIRLPFVEPLIFLSSSAIGTTPLNWSIFGRRQHQKGAELRSRTTQIPNKLNPKPKKCKVW